MKDVEDAMQAIAAAILADPKAKARLDELAAEKAKVTKLRDEARLDKQHADGKWVDASNQLRAAEMAESRAKNMAMETSKRDMELNERARDIAAREAEHERRVAAHAAMAADIESRHSILSRQEVAVAKREAAVRQSENEYREKLAALKRIVG